ncbi:DUF2878 domain-containing protein [Aliiglaciecola litoralis]|uniref:DUF2878 domain-containing protein n=1 Tax=Aliiglaciecola litoralis TaxID=582857 RepID=A0ABN1LCX2_9ALTE
MNLFSYSNLHNFIWFQGIWFAAIFGGNQGLWLTLIAFAIVGHFFWVENWLQELKHILACCAVGLTVDTLLTLNHIFEFPEHATILPIPIWLIAIWIAFTGTLKHSLNYLVKKPILMTFLAGLTAPLSYIAAARVGVVNFPLGYLNTFLIVGASWMLMVPIFYWLQTHFDKNSNKTGN